MVAHLHETVMKIEDLELVGADGLDAAVYLRQHEKGDAKKKSVSRFNWNLRTIRYQTAIHLLRELCRLGVHCYVITHMKPVMTHQVMRLQVLINLQVAFRYRGSIATGHLY